MCHEAYEASLVASGIALRDFFNNPNCALPIAESKANFFRPMYCGDELDLSLTPQLISPSEFSITYILAVTANDVEVNLARRENAVQAFTRHVAIDPAKRKRCPLSSPILEWLHQWSDVNKDIPLADGCGA